MCLSVCVALVMLQQTDWRWVGLVKVLNQLYGALDVLNYILFTTFGSSYPSLLYRFAQGYMVRILTLTLCLSMSAERADT